jgi:hypothetical protein
MHPTSNPEDFVEIYHTDSLMAAQKIIDVLLTPAGIAVQIHDRIDQAFPSLGKAGGVFIAVQADLREKALAILDEAREDGFLDGQDGAKV